MEQHKHIGSVLKPPCIYTTIACNLRIDRLSSDCFCIQHLKLVEWTRKWDKYRSSNGCSKCISC
jgi:hypothetical protein